MKTPQLCVIVFSLLSLHFGSGVCALQNIIYVARDGSSGYTTIGAAIAAAPNNSITRTYIIIKPGTYKENIIVPSSKTMLTLIGYGMDKTFVSSDRSNGSGFPTDKTATADIFGADFVAMNITFENTAGASNNQAIALKSEVRSTFYRCRFSGYQDTLCANAGNQFYRECEIYGTVDFIFGDAKAVFQNSIIFARTPFNGNKNTITAQSRDSPTDIGGYVFHNCTIRAAPNLQGWVKTYFGRPWRIYSRVVIMQSDIHPLIDPEGWMNWDVTKPVDNLYYAEYDNRGAGADTSRRVGWSKLLHTKAEANQFTVRNFINGNNWIPVQIPYFQDLM